MTDAGASACDERCRVTAVRVGWGWFKNYSYLITDPATGQAALVDPAWDLAAIVRAVEETGSAPTAVLLTHSHFDHVNLAGEIVKRWGARVYMSRIEIEVHDFDCANLEPIEDMQEIGVGEVPVVGLVTPGHTSGGTCYLAPGALFTGDTLFSEGCGLCAGRGASADAMYETVQRVKREVGLGVRVYPGHSYGVEPGRTLGELVDCNIYLSIEDRDTFVGFRNRPNQHGLFDFKWGSKDWLR